ncbi:MAG: DUF2100 domain-containing protein [Candidatus Helarchaeota archaeon]
MTDIKTLIEINELINLLIELKNLYKQFTPTFKIDEKAKRLIRDHLLEITKRIMTLNELFGVKLDSNLDKLIQSFKNAEKILFIINSPKNKKRLIDLGLKPSQILSIGGPINIEDLKELNPNLSIQAIDKIKKKIKKFWEKFESKLQKEKFEKIIILIEENNPTDQILARRLGDFQSKVIISVEFFVIPSF